MPYLDGNVVNEDANWDEIFWDQVSHEVKANEGYLIARTKKTSLEVANGMFIKAFCDGIEITQSPVNTERSGYVEASYTISLAKNSKLDIYKYIGVLSSLYHSGGAILGDTKQVLKKAAETGFEKMQEAHTAKWAGYLGTQRHYCGRR